MSQNLDSLLKESSEKDWSQFVPYVIHNVDTDQVSVYLKGSCSYCESLNDHVDVYKNIDTNEIVGVKIKNFSKVDKL